MILHTGDEATIGKIDINKARSMSQGFGRGVISLKARYNRKILLSIIMLDKAYHQTIQNHRKRILFADLFTQHKYLLSTQYIKYSLKYKVNFDDVYISWLEIKNNKMYAHIDSNGEAEKLYRMAVNYAMVMGHLFNKSEVEEIAAITYGLAKLTDYLERDYKIRRTQREEVKPQQARLAELNAKYQEQFMNNTQYEIIKILIHQYLNNRRGSKFMGKVFPHYQDTVHKLLNILKPGFCYNDLNKSYADIAVLIYLNEYESIKSRLTKSQNKQAVKLFNGLDKRGNIDKLFS